MKSFFDDKNFTEDIEEQIGDIEKLTDDEFFDKLELNEYNEKIKKSLNKILEQNNHEKNW